MALLSLLFIVNVHCSLFMVIVNLQCCNNIVGGLILRWKAHKAINIALAVPSHFSGLSTVSSIWLDPAAIVLKWHNFAMKSTSMSSTVPVPSLPASPLNLTCKSSNRVNSYLFQVCLKLFIDQKFLSCCLLTISKTQTVICQIIGSYPVGMYSDQLVNVLMSAFGR